MIDLDRDPERPPLDGLDFPTSVLEWIVALEVRIERADEALAGFDRREYVGTHAHELAQRARHILAGEPDGADT